MKTLHIKFDIYPVHSYGVNQVWTKEKSKTPTMSGLYKLLFIANQLPNSPE